MAAISSISGLYLHPDYLGLCHFKLYPLRLKFALNYVIKTVGNFSISLSMDVCIDKIIVPILLYASGGWGTQHRELIELVHTTFCKYIMSVSYNNSNAAMARHHYQFYTNTWVSILVEHSS